MAAFKARSLRILIRSNFSLDSENTLSQAHAAMNHAEQLTLAKIAELVIQRAELELKRPAQSSCRSGCGACCRQLVTISPGEALRIADLVDQMPPERGEMVRQKFSESESRLESAGMVEIAKELASPAISDERHYEIAQQYFRLGVACPFLEDESCSIHADRPAICREYHVSSPPKYCDDPFSESIAVIPTTLKIDEAQKLLDAHLMKTDVTPIPLALAMKWKREHPEARELRFDASKVRALLDEYLMMSEQNGDTE